MTTKKTPKKKSAAKTLGLNAEQELFCVLYTGHHNRDLFSNATRCYMEAYGHNARVDSIRKKMVEIQNNKDPGYTIQLKTLEAEIKSIEGSAKTAGNRLLTLVHIRGRIDSLMDKMISDEFNDREMQWVITQRFDLPSKVAAMREYNALKKRITKDPPPAIGPITIQIAPEVAAKIK